MNKKIRVILVNAKDKTATEDYVDGSFLDYLNKHVAPLVDVVGISEKDDGWVDDEGLINGTEDFIIWRGYGNPLAGNMVISGHNREGETISTEMSVSDVKKNIIFMTRHEVATMMQLLGN